ncbi:MAG: hypothetical protein IJ391_01015 [Clostridia bacterium]|nr:hypothetical protein [Clostridia bacterium]
MINYAHRGASQYAPENTLSSFYLGLLQNANGIETDVRRSKDGELILFHDDTLERVAEISSRVNDLTLHELKQIKIYKTPNIGFYDRIVTFREFLEHFASYDINFAIELKDNGIEADVLKLTKEFGIMEKTTFTSFAFDYLKNIKDADKSARIGWLIVNPDEQSVERLLEIGGEEIAPKAENITKELMQMLRSKNLGVRAWGVSNTELMKKMCELKVDGMTVNFPDLLQKHICGTKE